MWLGWADVIGVSYVAECGVCEQVYAAASEDMDTLTFATPYLIRRLTFNVARDMPPLQFSYVKLLEGLGLSPAEVCCAWVLCH